MVHTRTLLAGLVLLLMLTSTSGASLIDGGEVHNDSRVLAWYDLGDGGVLTVDAGGAIVEHLWSLGLLQKVNQIEANVSVNAVRFDAAAGLIALGHDNGAIVLMTDSGEVVRDIQTVDPVEHLDWDNGGDLWLVHNGGVRQAVEFGPNGPSGARTTVMSGGVATFLVLDDGRILTAGFDGTVLVHADDGTQEDQISGLGAAVKSLVEDGLDLWIGLSNGAVHRFSTVTWQGLSVSSSTTPVTSLSLDGDSGVFVGHQNGQVKHVDASLNIVQGYQATGSVIAVTVNDDGSLHLISTTSSSTRVRLFDVDSDGDGVADAQDAFPTNADQASDRDGDGYGDNSDAADGDAFPDDSTQWADRDGDGYGDDLEGAMPDAFPDDPNQWVDEDGDGVGDNDEDPNGDAFPEDPTQWADDDRDGYGDNPSGYRPDDCPESNGFSTNDRLGCTDRDLDGWSDPDDGWTVADGADAFPTERTQWADSDGDGYGDAQDGVRPDACPTVPGASIQALVPVIEEVTTYSAEAMFGCPDEDGDGWADASEVGDGMAQDPSEHLDQDGDGVGQRTDYNDTNALVSTVEDHCRLAFDDVRDICLGIRSVEYQDYLSTLNESERSRMTFSYWNATVANGRGAGGVDMNLVKQVSMLAGLVFVGMTAAILTVSAASRRRNSTAAESQKTFVGFGDSDSISEEALTGHAGLSARGGVEDDALWRDDPMESEKDAMNANEAPLQPMPAEPQEMGPEGAEERENEAQATGVGPTPAIAETSATDDAPLTESGSEAKEHATAPPVPESGLPKGWTMEQWEHYGHQWLAKQAED